MPLYQRQMDWNQPCAVRVFLISTPPRSWKGLEWVYQSILGLPIREIHLHPMEAWSVTIDMRVHFPALTEVHQGGNVSHSDGEHVVDLNKVTSVRQSDRV